MKTHKIIFNDNESIEFEATKEFLEVYPSGDCLSLNCRNCPLAIDNRCVNNRNSYSNAFKNTKLEELDTRPDEPIVEGKLVYYDVIARRIFFSHDYDSLFKDSSSLLVEQSIYSNFIILGEY